jgi:hypothetical protein
MADNTYNTFRRALDYPFLRFIWFSRSMLTSVYACIIRKWILLIFECMCACVGGGWVWGREGRRIFRMRAKFATHNKPLPDYGTILVTEQNDTVFLFSLQQDFSLNRWNHIHHLSYKIHLIHLPFY